MEMASNAFTRAQTRNFAKGYGPIISGAQADAWGEFSHLVLHKSIIRDKVTSSGGLFFRLLLKNTERCPY